MGDAATSSSSSSSSSSAAQQEVEQQKGIRRISLPRTRVRVSDVRVASFLGPKADGIGFISLGGFNSNAAQDFRNALLTLRFNAPGDLRGMHTLHFMSFTLRHFIAHLLPRYRANEPSRGVIFSAFSTLLVIF
jgi:hypothetical protein